MAASTPSPRPLSLLAGWLLALAVAALCARLGMWQLARMRHKQAMLDAVAQVTRDRIARPLSVAGDAARAGGYDWAGGGGRFAPLPAVLLDNQQRAGRPGVLAYRVFVPERGEPLLVELGWLPLPPDRSLPRVEIPRGISRIEGLLLPPPAAGLARRSAQPGPGSVLVTRLAPAEVATELALSALAPRVLRLDPRLSWGYPRDLDVMPNTLTPQRHLGYAVQWFGLALAVLATAALLTLRKARRHG